MRPAGKSVQKGQSAQKGQTDQTEKGPLPFGAVLATSLQKISGTLHFVAFQASCADIAGLRLSVLHETHLLHVGFEGSSGSAFGVADIVAGRLTFTANTANSGHIFTPPR